MVFSDISLKTAARTSSLMPRIGH